MIVTREEVRQKVAERVEQLAGSWVGYPLSIEYDNKLLNQSAQSDPYLAIKMIYMDGGQIDLGANPGHRAIGTLIVEAWDKVGNGKSASNRLLQHFYPHLHMTDSLSPLRLRAARFSTSAIRNGWVAEASIVPFWYDSIP